LSCFTSKIQKLSRPCYIFWFSNLFRFSRRRRRRRRLLCELAA
jgi:hypothetical protein